MPTFRRFTTADLDACVALFLSVFTAPPWRDGWTSADHARSYLLEYVQNPVFRGWVAEEDHRIVGLCFGHMRSWWRGPELYVDEMCVALNLHRRGVGTAFLEHVKAELRAQGMKGLTLLTDRGSSAEAFYTKNGFRRQDRMVFMASGV
jgi:GNAT superfamily N-acetyltransferase